MNINSPRNYTTLRLSANTYDQKQQKQDLINMEGQRNKYYDLSIKLKEQNQRLVIANKYLQNDEDQLRKKLQQLKKKISEEEKKSDIQLYELKKQVEKNKIKSTPKGNKQNVHYLNNCQSQLDCIKIMLKKAQQEQQPKISELVQSIEMKQNELLNLRKQLNNITLR